MLRFLSRFAGLVFLAAAFACVIVDGTRSLAAGEVRLFSAAQTAIWLVPTRAAALEAALAGFQSQPILDALGVLGRAPTWLVFGLLGAVFLLLGRRPAPTVGFSGRP